VSSRAVGGWHLIIPDEISLALALAYTALIVLIKIQLAFKEDIVIRLTPIMLGRYLYCFHTQYGLGHLL
jgi:hypothetical protein